jgi:glycosyl transferase, family 25
MGRIRTYNKNHLNMWSGVVDRYVYETFFRKYPAGFKGYFVDVGASDGCVQNNTLAFERQLGWRGLCVEPNPSAFLKLSSRRPASIACQVAISDKCSTATKFYAVRGYASARSGLVEGYDLSWKDVLAEVERMGGATSVIDVPTTTLPALCKQQDIKRIDYLAIDIPHSHAKLFFTTNDLPPTYIISINNHSNNNHMRETIKTKLISKGFQFIDSKDSHDIYANLALSPPTTTSTTTNSRRMRKFGVNLDRRADRWVNFEKVAKKVGLENVERFSASDGKLLSLQDRDVGLFPAKLRRGAVGCALSHLRLWRQLLADENCDFYAVWEDDVEFNDGFAERFDRLLHEQLPLEWNLVWMGFTGPELHAGKRIPGPSKLLPTGWEYYGGTWAYLISKAGAKRLVEWIEAGKCNTTIDSWLSNMGPQAFPTFKCTPYLCWTQMGDAPGTDSDIQQDIQPIAKRIIRLGLVDGGEWFATFLESLLTNNATQIQTQKMITSSKTCAPPPVDIWVHSVMGNMHHTFAKSNALSVCIVGEPRPISALLQDRADFRLHCCLPDDIKTASSASDNFVRCVDADANLWYVPHWITSFYERKNPDHTLSKFLQRALTSPSTKQPIGEKFCAFMYSNDVEERNRFFDLLSKYKRVDALGKCRSNVSNVVYDRNLYDANETFYDAAVKRYEGYKFVIAFENTRQRGYITEKLINPWLTPSQPVVIYFGAPDVGEYFNQKSFIDVSQFANFEAAIDYIRQVDQSDQLYNQIRQQPHMTSTQTNRFNLQPLSLALHHHLTHPTPPPPPPPPASAPLAPPLASPSTDVTRTTRTALTESGGSGAGGSGASGASGGEGEWMMVSALFDIPAETGIKSSNRSIDFYLTHRFVIELDVPLVLFCDPSTYPKLWKLRKAAGLLHKTCFVTMHLRDFPLYTYRDRIAENRRKPPVYSPDHRNTPDFFVLTASKFHMVQRAIEMNPFNTKYVCWCDYGIQHVGDGSQAKAAYIKDAFQQRRIKPSFCYIAYLSPRIALDPFQMYSFGDGRCTIAAGFFTGSNELMLPLCVAIDKEFRKVVELGRGHAEEQLLATVHARDPQAFEMFYGDYYELITNYVWVRSNPEAVLNLFIDRAAEDKNWNWMLPACEKLYLSQYTHKTVNLNPSQIVRLFERYVQVALELKLDQLHQKLVHHFQHLSSNSSPILQIAQAKSYAKSKLLQPLTGGATTTIVPYVRRVLRPSTPRPAPRPAPSSSVVESKIVDKKIVDKSESERERIKRLLDKPNVVVSESEATTLSSAAWSNVDAVVYINLDSRTDRAKEFLAEVARLFIPLDKVHRFSAINASPGAVGCSASHLAVLQMARDKKWRNVLVFEDDFNFIGDTRLVWQNLIEFFKTYGSNFDVVQLTSHCNDYVSCDNIVKYARKASNGSGYIVHSRFYDPLIARWEGTLPLLKQTGQDWLWINDQSWQALQTGNWFAFVPLLGYQRPSFSDLSHKPADPHGIL